MGNMVHEKLTSMTPMPSGYLTTLVWIQTVPYSWSDWTLVSLPSRLGLEPHSHPPPNLFCPFLLPFSPSPLFFFLLLFYLLLNLPAKYVGSGYLVFLTLDTHTFAGKEQAQLLCLIDNEYLSNILFIVYWSVDVCAFVLLSFAHNGLGIFSLTFVTLYSNVSLHWKKTSKLIFCKINNLPQEGKFRKYP